MPSPDTRFRIPALHSGGIILSYRCSSRCGHCLYACGPERQRRWMSEADLEFLFSALAREPSLSGVHLAGGEAVLNLPLLETALELANRHGVRVDYLETNAAWASSQERTQSVLKRLRAAGLKAILISVSPFHLPYVPFEHTVRCIDEAMRIFRGNVIVWQGHWLELFQSMGITGRVPLADLIARFPAKTRKHIPPMYSLTPGGRAGYALRDLYDSQPASAFAEVNCRRRLTGTIHFHIDPDLNLIPDLCSGIAAAHVRDLHAEQDLQTRPVLRRLYAETLGDLLDWAAREHGYREDPAGYVAPCHLCVDIRRHLSGRDAAPELQPRDFYGSLQ